MCFRTYNYKYKYIYFEDPSSWSDMDMVMPCDLLSALLMFLAVLSVLRINVGKRRHTGE